MSGLGTLGEKFPEELRKKYRLEQAGIEILSTPGEAPMQKSEETGDKNNAEKGTHSAKQPTLARDTTMSETIENKVQNGNVSVAAKGPKANEDLAEVYAERVTQSIEAMARGFNESYSAIGTVIMSAGAGAAVGGAVGGSLVAFLPAKTPDTGTILTGVAVGGAMGAGVGAATGALVTSLRRNKK